MPSMELVFTWSIMKALVFTPSSAKSRPEIRSIENKRVIFIFLLKSEIYRNVMFAAGLKEPVSSYK